MDAFWAAPPVIRTLTALTVVQSALMYSGLVSFYWALFVPSLIFSWRPQIFRLVTPFLLTGPRLSFIFDLILMYRYGSAAERSMAPGEFFIYLLFVAFSIMARESTPASVQHHHNSQNSGVVQLTAGGYLGQPILLSPLIMAFVYTFSQTNRGTKTRFWVIDIPVVLLPYAMIVVGMVMNGWEHVLSDLTGIVAAHTYDFLTRIYPTFGGGRNFIPVPRFVERYFTDHDPNSGYRPYGTASRAPRPAEPSSASGSSWSSWTSSSSWNGRGAGRRLG
ncbi:hypothetical protein DTO013E5_3966 [Penicillium roqueforti]|uniref:uncharacterized protein n=1 Tax=Penicillium roqueforti TaxID=5082 RepID=UPI00190B231E|nr:uncharacterized protein LCP9604111_1603 [Penicillium roqueforti]KAF9251607.1 hypothetical protein LCP9604111_1603 [Penicillium roqueforti]KAI1836580.1 hypothetical protein CBS147337_2807 [Penicillium roqueforti]KAI2685282.1 hypothetical protein LCP963914a_4609 [Penicillium roqueforti]KAI2690371.1 hypothetical protein CBS147355_822 [Penicillium roqueforti]KAI2695654.1 hypothetical protein CBS147372_9071 [Penicillium roqueforti]